MSYIYEIKQTTDLYHDLKRMGRDNFSYDGAAALMEWLENMGEPLEYDPIAFCCDFAEYSDSRLPGLASEYSNAPQPGEFEDLDEWEVAFKEWLADQTSVIEFDGGIIVQSF